MIGVFEGQGLRRTFGRLAGHALDLGGGALLDLGVYPVSFASQLFGAPQSIQAVATFKETGADAQVATMFRYPGGQIATTYSASTTRGPNVAVVLVDMRNRDLTIKGQEILTADKVAIRVSILVQFSVIDPKTAIHAVASYEDRLYSDVQLAARRSLAAMTLEEILTNRHRLSEDILREVKEAAAGYGVAIARADVKDLVFPGNLQEIMNKVLAAERTSQAQLVEARTRAEVQRIDAQTKADAARVRDCRALANSSVLVQRWG